MALPGRGAMSSSPTSLSSPPASSISNPSSPSRLNVGRANIEMDEIVVDTASGPRFGVVAPPAPPPPDVPLTAAGLPRKKPGRKPGSTVKPKLNPDGTPIVPEPKVRKPRKPRDPNAPPIQRKRKIAATQEPAEPEQPSALASSSAAHQAQEAAEPSPMRMDLDSRPAAAAAVATPASSSNTPIPQPNPAKVPKREGPSFMSSLLNRDSPPPPPAPPAPVRMAFDPVRSSSYDPVRETMVTRDPYGTSALASPRGPSQMPNRASASPSISSLIDAPAPSSNSKVVSPTQAHSSFHSTSQGRFQDPSSLPPSPSNQVRKDPPPLSGPAPKSSTVEIKKPGPPPMPQPPKATEPFKPTAPASSGMPAPSTMPAPSKKLTTVAAQSRKDKKPVSSTSSSPKMGSLKNALPDVAPLPGHSNDRSILDFGKVAPGDEKEAPSIVLHIPLNRDGNKYVNFMRLAESKYGWDALHPREAANRDRKARIAAASAALERQQSGRDSAEEEDPEFNASEDENSNIEMGGMGNNGGLTSGADAAAPEKPKRKKRNWREDEYDRGDDFVDDSELLWEEQAAAVQDGFFVYSGPLVQELPKAPEREGPAKRGRGRGGGPGSRGGRGRGEGGRGRGGGPGSRGGTTTRKPRITKAEKQQLDREKAEREQKAQQLAASKSSGSGGGANGSNSAAGSYGLLAGLVGPNASVPSLSAGLGAGIMNS